MFENNWTAKFMYQFIRAKIWDQQPNLKSKSCKQMKVLNDLFIVIRNITCPWKILDMLIVLMLNSAKRLSMKKEIPNRK